jgi:hypothetical protein
MHPKIIKRRIVPVAHILRCSAKHISIKIKTKILTVINLFRTGRQDDNDNDNLYIKLPASNY